MANGEDAIRRAIATGDAKKIAQAHADYVQSMESHGQNAQDLSHFTGR